MNALRRITPFLQHYRWVLVAGLLTTILPVAMELVAPRMLQLLVDRGIRASNMQIIFQSSMIMLSSAVLGALATLGQGIFRAQLSQGIAYDLRNALFTHIQSLSFANLDQIQTGQLMTRISSDVDVVRMFASAGLSLLLRALMMIVGSMIMLLFTDWQLALIMLGLLAVAGFLIRAIIRAATPLFTVVQQKLAALNTLVQENLAGVQVVKAFVREKYASERFGESNLDYMEQNVKVGRLMALALPLLGLVTNVGMVIIIWRGGLDVIAGRITVGELIAFNNYLMIGMAPLLLLSNMLSMVSRAEASAVRVLEVLDTEPAIKMAPSPYAPEKMTGRVVFDHVVFAYNGGDLAPQDNPLLLSGNGADSARGHEEVLNGVSFIVEPGQRLALLGATGSGKSTLVNLIPRFYDVLGGRICIDDVDVRAWSPADLRTRIGVVLQQTTLFSGTVRENIAYGRPEASLDEVAAAAQAAQAHDFIMAMPGGYDSPIEERGANLSGGQKQRIAIARALLIAPAILILDDATSSVDMDTEVKIQEALDEMMAYCTTFIVAQRINSVLKADQILVLDRGRIVAAGPHRQLLETSPIYQEIYRSQLGE